MASTITSTKLADVRASTPAPHKGRRLIRRDIVLITSCDLSRNPRHKSRDGKKTGGPTAGQRRQLVTESGELSRENLSLAGETKSEFKRLAIASATPSRIGRTSVLRYYYQLGRCVKYRSEEVDGYYWVRLIRGRGKYLRVP